MTRATTVFHEARELLKKARYAQNFMAGRLVHTNLQITYRCNFHCDICDFWQEEHRAKTDLTAEDTRIVADQLAKIGPQIVSIGGGEPMLNTEVIDIVRVLARHHFPVMICNGWYITPERARALWAAGMYEISVSVDYDDPVRHDTLRGKEGAFERALRALEILHEQRTRAHQRVNMITVLMDDNLTDIEQLIQRCEGMAITYLLTLYSDKRGALAKRSVLGDVSTHLLELHQRYPHFVALRSYIGRFTESIRKGGIGPCYAGKYLCNVDTNGDVSLCIDRVDESVGTLMAEPMATIEQRLLELHRTNTCRDCWTSCRGCIESIRHGAKPHVNLLDYWRMTKPVGLNARFR